MHSGRTRKLPIELPNEYEVHSIPVKFMIQVDKFITAFLLQNDIDDEPDVPNMHRTLT